MISFQRDNTKRHPIGIMRGVDDKAAWFLWSLDKGLTTAELLWHNFGFCSKTTMGDNNKKNGIYYRRLLEAMQSLKVYLFLHQNWDEWSVIGWQPGWGTVLCSAYGWSVEFSAKLVSVVTSKAFKMITRWTLKNVIYIQVLYWSYKASWRDTKCFLDKFMILGNNQLVFYWP